MNDRDKQVTLLSGSFPAMETLVMSEGFVRMKSIGGSSPRQPGQPGTRRPIAIAPGPAPTFALLPQPASRWQSLTASLLVQILGIAVLMIIPMIIVDNLPNHEYQTMALLPPQPLTLRPDPAPLPPPKPRIAQPKPAEIRKPVFLSPPKMVAPKPVVVPAPEVKPVFQPTPLEMARPAKPRAEVKTGVLPDANIPLPTVAKPASKVQTGGFGNPLGQSGEAKPGSLTVARAGSFDLPPGKGLGNGTGGAKGTAGIVADAGFGKAVGPVSAGSPGGGSPAVRTGGFGTASASGDAGKKVSAPAGPTMVPVEILSKPAPAYTAEARRLKKEGEVLLEVVFTASGEVRVISVLQGLGYGLDESAVAAAKQLKFRPAKRDGQPVDSTAKLHIVFQLAY